MVGWTHSGEGCVLRESKECRVAEALAAVRRLAEEPIQENGMATVQLQKMWSRHEVKGG